MKTNVSFYARLRAHPRGVFSREDG